MMVPKTTDDVSDLVLEEGLSETALPACEVWRWPADWVMIEARR